MDRFRSIEVFVAVAEAGSLSGAALGLGMSVPAVSRALGALEDGLGVRLVMRTTRSLRLTETGSLYLARCRAVLAAMKGADEEAAGNPARPRGHLRLTAPTLFGQLHVVPAILGFLDRHPEMTVEGVFVDRVANLVEEGFDVAVRIGPLPDTRLIATGVGAVRRMVCAAPDYLKRHGRPDAPADLRHHRIISATAVTPTDEWGFDRAGRVRVAPRLRVTTVDAAIAAARSGGGLTRVLSYQIAGDLASGALVRVLDGAEPPPVPVHLVWIKGSETSAKVRAFIDHARAALGQALARQAG